MLGYIHQVRSYKRSISVTTLFSPTRTFNSSGCENLNMSYTPMSEAPIHWTYKEGDQTIDLGYNNLVIVRSDIQRIFRELKLKKVSRKLFTQEMGKEMSDNWQVPLEEVYDKYFDPSGKGFFTEKDIEQLPIENIKGIARSMETPAGPLSAAEKIDWEKILQEKLALEKQEEEFRKKKRADRQDDDDDDDDDDEMEEEFRKGTQRDNGDNDDDEFGMDDDDRDEPQDEDQRKQHQHQEL